MSDLRGCGVGWWGVPGGPPGGMVHIVRGGRPACGAKVHRDAQLQLSARWIERSYLECRKCIALHDGGAHNPGEGTQG